MTERGLEVGHAIVVTDGLVHEFDFLAECQPFQVARLVRPAPVIGGDHPPFAGGNDLVGIKAETPDVADAADFFSLVGGAMSLGGVLDYEQPMFSGHRHYRIHIHRVTKQVDHDNSLGSCRYSRLKQIRIQIEGIRLDVDWNRNRALVDHREKRRHICQGRHQNLVTLADAERREREMDRRSAAGGGHPEFTVAVLRKFALE